MKELITHSFEAGRWGKPDELDTSIANKIAAHLLRVNPDARFDLRVTGSASDGQPHIRIGGEISQSLYNDPDLEDSLSVIAMDRYNFIHKTDLPAHAFHFHYLFKPQSDKLAQNGESGDSGNPIAVAYADTPNNLPWERYISVAIRDAIDFAYHTEGHVKNVPVESPSTILGLRADGKVGVSARYNGADLDSLSDVTIAVEHEPDIPVDYIQETLTTLVHNFLDYLQETNDVHFGSPRININGAGPWNKGGWEVDEGSREAKPYRDGFASYGVCEDSFSGEDPSKPSGTGTFLARYIANQVVESGFADFARVNLDYAIGVNEVGLNVFTNGTGMIEQDELHEIVREQTPLSIKEAVGLLGLKDPNLFETVALDSDYFHNPNLPWNNVPQLKQ